MASSNCTKELSFLPNIGARFSQNCVIMTKPPLTFPSKTAKISDVLFWQKIHPPYPPPKSSQIG